MLPRPLKGVMICAAIAIGWLSLSPAAPLRAESAHAALLRPAFHLGAALAVQHRAHRVGQRIRGERLMEERALGHHHAVLRQDLVRVSGHVQNFQVGPLGLT